MQAWADGLNTYLATHPDVHPHVLTHFEPWMALSFSEGSIGGDIERVPLTQLQAFYEKRHLAMTSDERGLVLFAPPHCRELCISEIGIRPASRTAGAIGHGHDDGTE